MYHIQIHITTCFFYLIAHSYESIRLYETMRGYHAAIHTISRKIAKMQNFEAYSQNGCKKHENPSQAIGIFSYCSFGWSGLSIGFPVSYVTGIPICVVRKPKEESHSSYKTEGYGEMLKYFILDDLISSGDTLEQMAKTIKECAGSSDVNCVGIGMYYRSSGMPIPGQKISKKDEPLYFRNELPDSIFYRKRIPLFAMNRTIVDNEVVEC